MGTAGTISGPSAPQGERLCSCLCPCAAQRARAAQAPALLNKRGSHGEEKVHSPLGAMGPGSPCKEGDRALTGAQPFCMWRQQNPCPFSTPQPGQQQGNSQVCSGGRGTCSFCKAPPPCLTPTQGTGGWNRAARPPAPTPFLQSAPLPAIPGPAGYHRAGPCHLQVQQSQQYVRQEDPPGTQRNAGGSWEAENGLVSPQRSGWGIPKQRPQTPTWNHMVLPLWSRRELMPGTK